MDLLKLLKYKAEYGTVYYAEQADKYVVCRQPTIAELAQLQDIQRSRKLTLQQQCQLIQRQTKVDGTDDLKLLEQVGEQILVDVPNDESEYMQSQVESLEKMCVHDEVAVYIATNLGMDLNQVRKLSVQQAQQLFGLAKKVEEILSNGAQVSEPVQHKIQVNPVMRNA